MQFHVRAMNARNEVIAMRLEAASEALAREAARRDGYRVLAVSAAGLRGRLFAARSRFSVTLFSIELLALLEAGLNLVEALQALSEKTSNEENRQVLLRLLALLNQGESFSRALEKLHEHFTPLYVATARASERTGDLKDALARFVAYQEEFDRVRRKVITASLYPAILLAVGSAVFLFLLFYVVPRFARIYEDIQAQLPFFSSLLIQAGSAVEKHGFVVTVFFIALAAAALYGWVSEPARAWLNQRLWRVPAIGERMKLYQLARLYRTLGMLLRSGVPIVRAIDMVAGSLPAHMRRELLRARRLLEEGKAISTAFAEVGLATSVAARMLAVGERSGSMGELMERIARFYDGETSRAIETFARTFEPALMAILGVGVGLVVVLMYMPVFELAGNIQ